VSFFVSTRGNRMVYPTINAMFRNLCDSAGIGARATSPPRIHDLRHILAVGTLLGLYLAGEDADGRLPALSTYHWHRDPRWTYWYLSAAPELLAMARTTPGNAEAGENPMSPIAPTLQAFLPTGCRAAAGRPAHRRFLPRLAQAVARVHPEPHRQALPAWIGPTSMTTWSPRSSTARKRPSLLEASHRL
jgi:hypothetical protein